MLSTRVKFTQWEGRWSLVHPRVAVPSGENRHETHNVHKLPRIVLRWRVAIARQGSLLRFLGSVAYPTNRRRHRHETIPSIPALFSASRRRWTHIHGLQRLPLHHLSRPINRPQRGIRRPELPNWLASERIHLRFLHRA